ncbi:MAG TPA: CPBP family intramembrane glutamic endopeptidase [Flavobacteriales bacterium]|nr:CPBP family intramembrane glutamic endopeptidase [Flavobacteriales bacterium]
MSNRSLIILMGYTTLILFPLVAILVLYFVSGSWQFIFKNGWPIYAQIPIGIALGLAIGLGLREMLKTKPFAELTHKYAGFLGDFELSRPEYVFLSVCAGVGEEILFRGCIQYYAGIVPTAIIFVAMHGYLNPFDRWVTVYGIVLTAIFIGVGYVMAFSGIYVCIILHIVIDVILFGHLLSSQKNKI